MPHDEPKKNAAPSAIEPVSRSTTYPLSRLAPRMDLVDVAKEIQDADRMLGAVVGGQLEVIAEQIRRLQDKAKTLLEKAEHAARLHRASCHFKKRPGHVYHLYERGSDDLYLSMLSPEEWAGAPPHPFLGSYRLELDMSWTRIDGE